MKEWEGFPISSGKEGFSYHETPYLLLLLLGKRTDPIPNPAPYTSLVAWQIQGKKCGVGDSPTQN